MPVISEAAGVASISGKSYKTLQDAVKAVKNNQTIKLNSNIKTYLDIYLKTNKTFTIDLNKKNIYGNLIINGGNITIKNGSIGDSPFERVYFGYQDKKNSQRELIAGTTTKIKLINVKSSYIINVAPKCTLTIDGGTYRRPVCVKGKLTIEKGNFLMHPDGTNSIDNLFLYCGSQTVIKDGKFRASGSNFVLCYGRYRKTEETKKPPVLNIKKANVQSDDYIFNGAGTVTIDSGTYVSKKRAIQAEVGENNKYKKYCKFVFNNGTLKTVYSLNINNFVMNGGKITSNSYHEGETVAINGGTYTLNIDVPASNGLFRLNSLKITKGNLIVNIDKELFFYDLDIFAANCKVNLSGGKIKINGPSGVVLPKGNTSKLGKGLVLNDTTPDDKFPLSLYKVPTPY